MESIARINQNGCVQALEEGSMTLTAKFKNFTASINITVGPAIVYDDDNESDLQIITESLDKAFTGKIYNFTLKASESNNIKWSHTGELPPGLDLSESGIISGTPTKSGTYKFTVTASNGTDLASKEFTMIVSASGSSLEITTTTLKNGTDGKKYSDSLKAKGAKSLTWQAANLPDGLTINPSNGKISGTPTAAPGEYNITVTAYNDKIPAEYSRRETSQNFTLIINNNPDPKKAYITPQNSILANNNASDSDSSSKLDSEIINEPEKVLSSNENLFIGSERDINSLNINISDDYIVAAVLPEIHVNKSGLYELEIELDENAQTNSKLYWLACPQNNNPSEDDSIAEFYDESGQEIFAVPENKLITVSAWLNKDIIYAPVILVSK